MARILIIEDDPYVQRFYRRVFAFQNYEVELASNGEEGIEKAKILQPNLILLDIIMPGIDGLEVLKRLKTDSVTQTIHVLMLTNLGEEQTVARAMELGAEGVLIKANVSPEQLVTEVEKYIQKSSAS